jgi:transposase-like protein
MRGAVARLLRTEAAVPVHGLPSADLRTGAGTIFHKSRTPLTKWFLAMHLLTASKNDIAALELARQIDVKWDTAWLIKQKLMEAMRQRNSIYKLAGEVQIDDAYQGGEKPGKCGRGAANKTPFVIAVQTRDGRPIYTQLRVLPAFTKEAIRDYAKASIEPGSRVLSDGLSCFNGLAEADMRHVVRITGGGRPKGSDFKWVNTGLGNVKSAITGTLRSCDPQHAPRYLAAFRVALQSPLRAEGEPRPARPSGGHDQPAAASFDHRDPVKWSGSVGVIRKMDARTALACSSADTASPTAATKARSPCSAWSGSASWPITSSTSAEPSNSRPAGSAADQRFSDKPAGRPGGACCVRAIDRSSQNPVILRREVASAAASAQHRGI